jgi:uncharacterized membrane protein YhaH (DUF805 family)
VKFGQAIAAGFSYYAKFSGRATRSEYLLWQLFVWIAGVAVLYQLAERLTLRARMSRGDSNEIIS